MLPLCPIILIIEILKINQIFMRRLITLFFLIFILSGVAMAQQMSDDQVIQYVKEAHKSGRSQKQITTDLLRRGVTKEQVSRIQQKISEDDGVSNKSNEIHSQTRQRALADDKRRPADYDDNGELMRTTDY